MFRACIGHQIRVSHFVPQQEASDSDRGIRREGKGQAMMGVDDLLRMRSAGWDKLWSQHFFRWFGGSNRIKRKSEELGIQTAKDHKSNHHFCI